MGVSIHFTPLYGAQSDARALAYVLCIDSFNILLDCGWTSAFDPAYLANLATVAPTIHAVLLSHPDVAHLGALPYAVAHLGLTATVFSTLPVWRMGQMYMYDVYQSMVAVADFDTFNLDHVDAAFETNVDDTTRFHLLKYQQHFPLDGLSGGSGIVITPHPAGHMLGGTVWNIKKDTESVLYAVDFNHRRERHLNPTTLASFSRPSHLILGASQVLTHTASRKPAELVDRIVRVLRRNGNVLIPIDTAGRVIEIAVQLNDMWAADRKFAQVPLVILHEFATRTFEFARSMIEWMSDEVVKRFDISRENLFDFAHVRLCQTRAEVDALPSPKVVLASSTCMEFGFARELFVQWGVDPRCGVILVDRPEPETLYSKLYHHTAAATKGGVDAPNGELAGAHEEKPLILPLTVRRKEYLAGEELQQWRERERAEAARAKEEEERLKAEAAAAETAVRHEGDEKRDVNMQAQDAADGKDGDSRDGAEIDVDASSKSLASAKGKKRAFVASPTSLEDYEEDSKAYFARMFTHLQKVGAIPEVGNISERVFPFSEPERPAWDDYGQIVDTTRFMVGEDPGEGAPVRNMAVDSVMGLGSDPHAGAVAHEIIPTKYVSEQITLTVACTIAFVDCAGLSDGDSMKRLVKDVEPRLVVLVAGSTEETEHFRAHLVDTLFAAPLVSSRKVETLSSGEDAAAASAIFCPGSMETVDITSHTSVYELVLRDSLVAGLAWSKVGLSKVAYVDGVISRGEPTENGSKDGTGDMMVLEKRAERKDLVAAAVLDGATGDASPPADASGDNAQAGTREDIGHPTVFIGTIMLNRLKDVLTKHGLRAEFAGGALCVENKETGTVVLVKKVGTHSIVIDGAFSEEYYQVRDLLYDELVIPI